MPKSPSTPSDRSFGVTFALIFASIGLWAAWHGKFVVGLAFGLLGAVTLAIALLRASLLHRMNSGWMRVGAALHAVVSPIVLGTIYAMVITPAALVIRALGRDAMRRRLEPELATYWISRDPPGPSPKSLSDQF